MNRIEQLQRYQQAAHNNQLQHDRHCVSNTKISARKITKQRKQHGGILENVK